MIKIDKKKIEQLAQGFQIPPKPDVLADIHEEKSKDNPNINTIAEIISRDVGLSANVLKVINSPRYGLSKTIVDIRQSTVLLGLQNILDLVSYFELRSAMTGKSAISLERFWDTAMEIAQFTRLWIHKLNLPGRQILEDSYSLGLFHECGIPMMAMKFPDYKTVLQEANSADKLFTAVENEHYQTNHADIGYFIAKSWNFPPSMCDQILRHHELGFLEDPSIEEAQKNMAGILKLSISAQHQYSKGVEHTDWPREKKEVLFYFGLSEDDYSEFLADVLEDFGREA